MINSGVNYYLQINHMKSIKQLFSLIPFFISILIAGEKVYIPSFFQEKRTYKLESQMIYAVTIINNGDVITGTNNGLAIYPHISKDWITMILTLVDRNGLLSLGTISFQ